MAADAAVAEVYRQRQAADRHREGKIRSVTVTYCVKCTGCNTGILDRRHSWNLNYVELSRKRILYNAYMHTPHFVLLWSFARTSY
jgi:hypothetical protein